MKVTGLLAAIFCFVIVGCKQKTVKINMLPSLAEADSAVVMYYHTKGDPRFFNMIKINTAKPLSVITKDVNDRVIEAKDTCVTQGKIYFYGKAGAVETIYFSRDPDCMTLSFIKTGEKYFTKMSVEANELLDSLEKNVIVLEGRKE
jgi:hypothetical protein